MPEPPSLVRVCFVCLGNICRSPTAEGVMRRLVAEAGLAERIEVESAGTSAHHVGEPPDRRAAATARRRGLRLEGRARQFEAPDVERLDLVVAMDRENLRALRALAPDAAEKLVLLRAFDSETEGEPDVPDPYYGGPHGFDDVFDLCERACRGLLDALMERHGLAAERS